MKTKIIYLLLAFMSLTCVLSAQTKDSINIELKGETLPTALSKFPILGCPLLDGRQQAPV